MERGVKEIGDQLTNFLKGRTGNNGIDPIETDDFRALGIVIMKCAVSVTLPDEIRNVDNNVEVEKREKEADLLDIRTMNLQVDETIRDFLKDKEMRIAAGENPASIIIPSRQEVWAMVDEQRTLKAKVRKVIQGGKLVNFSDTSK